MLGQELLDVIVRYPDHVWVFLHEFHALTGERAEQFRKRRREYERRVEAVFEAGARSGHFRPRDPRLSACAWLGMHNYTYLWLKADGRLSAVRLQTRSLTSLCGAWPTRQRWSHSTALTGSPGPSPTTDRTGAPNRRLPSGCGVPAVDDDG